MTDTLTRGLTMEIDKILTIAIGGAYVILTIVLYITNWINAIKSKNKEKQAALINATQSQITDSALQLIEDAEKFKNYTGEEKLNYVITRLKQINQTLYDEAGLIELVNKLVETTKNVNSKTKNINSKGGK